MKILLTLLVAANLFACSAKVDAPNIDFPDSQDNTPLNPTGALDLAITKGTISNFNKFKLQTSSPAYEVKYTFRPTSDMSLIYTNEVRQTEGCTESSYDAAFEWREFNSARVILTTTPIQYGESYNLKKDVNYEFAVRISKLACSSVRHSFLMEQR